MRTNSSGGSGRTLYQAVGMAIPQLVQLVNKYQQQGYRVQLDTDTIELVDDVMNDVRVRGICSSEENTTLVTLLLTPNRMVSLQ